MNTLPPGRSIRWISLTTSQGWRVCSKHGEAADAVEAAGADGIAAVRLDDEVGRPRRIDFEVEAVRNRPLPVTAAEVEIETVGVVNGPRRRMGRSRGWRSRHRIVGQVEMPRFRRRLERFWSGLLIEWTEPGRCGTARISPPWARASPESCARPSARPYCTKCSRAVMPAWRTSGLAAKIRDFAQRMIRRRFLRGLGVHRSPTSPSVSSALHSLKAPAADRELKTIQIELEKSSFTLRIEKLFLLIYELPGYHIIARAPAALRIRRRRARTAEPRWRYGS